MRDDALLDTDLTLPLVCLVIVFCCVPPRIMLFFSYLQYHGSVLHAFSWGHAAESTCWTRGGIVLENVDKIDQYMFVIA